VLAWIIEHWQLNAAIAGAFAAAVTWFVYAELCHETQRTFKTTMEQRTIPEINTALDKTQQALDKLAEQHIRKEMAEEESKKRIAEMCRAGMVTSKLQCAKAGLSLDEMARVGGGSR
jgi:hypothetical protein